MGRRATDKKQRLTEAAANRFHRDGMHSSSIAEIARDAAVPVGNVYYYFRTKDALAQAVLDHWGQRTGDSLGCLLPGAAPEKRLEAYLDASSNRAEIYAALGCPLVALASDLRQSGNVMAPLAAQVHAPQLKWIGTMFEAMGDGPAQAKRRAQGLLSALQGSFQLAHALGEPGVVVETVAGLKRQLGLPQEH